MPACHFSLGRIIDLKLEVWLLMAGLLRAPRMDVAVAWQLGKSKLAEAFSAGGSPVDLGLPLDPCLSSGPSWSFCLVVQLERTHLLWVFFWDLCLCKAPRGGQHGCVLSGPFSGCDPACNMTSVAYFLEKGAHFNHIGP